MVQTLYVDEDGFHGNLNDGNILGESESLYDPFDEFQVDSSAELSIESPEASSQPSLTTLSSQAAIPTCPGHIQPSAGILMP